MNITIWILQIQLAACQMCFSANLDKEFNAQGCLAKHNHYRAMKSIAPLKWDNNLAANALSYCKTLVGRGLKHSQNRNNVGENLAVGGGSCTGAVDMWMREKYNNEPIGANLYAVGHHSQVMWKRSMKLGCGTVAGYTCCQYYPAGNALGQRAW